jgi:HSP20 family molecular chaperone IbpA
MPIEEKRFVAPLINVKHNEEDSGLVINVDLAGASKESVDLDMNDGGFCVKAEAEGFRYKNCYMLAHDVKPDEAKAKFNSGLLIISVPFKETRRGYKVAIE